MAQGEFTKEEGKQTILAVEEMFEAIPKSKRFGFLGHLNDIALFLGAAIRVAPNEGDDVRSKG